ncbi:putative 2-hydroxyacid dehydrogenase [Erysiphe necator]|uniref:Putative hydroxyisocaproate dehydrogenase n=1 Tax=Uncinula necator TaxID=52586 RepID=A0A0B1P539_UNCNE|nr:putative 2-hydroxyacid dehydrogenase [Erysiphe necator]KHJ33383.1 putative hydroxyisocaproate dehydrogenase [Erysiphe necator]
MCTRVILRIGDISRTQEEWVELSKLGTLQVFNGKTRQDFIESCASGEFNDVFAIHRSNASSVLTGPFDTKIISSLPRSVRFICHNGAGYDDIDVEACSARGIRVSNTPTAVNQATADMTIFLMIGALRRIHLPYLAVRAGEWRGGSTFQPGHDPDGKLLGILGMGGIGRDVAHRAKAFGLRIQYHNRSQLPPELDQGASYVSFDQLIKTSDIISLNCSLTRETEKIIGKEEFDAMKKGVVLVNTARGKLIDEAALVDALDSGKVYSAGLDVYENEPQIHKKLLSNPHVMLLPHVGTGTVETERKMELLVIKNIESAMKTGSLFTPIPEQNHLTANA